MTALAPLPMMLGHEIRLYWRQSAARTSHGVLLATVIGLLVLAHLVSLSGPFILAELNLTRLDVLASLSSAGLFAMMMMISVALIGTVKLIYSRGDMDLLLSSPIPAHAIVFVRVLAIAFGLFCLAGLMVLPFANVMAAFGHPRFLIAYVGVVCLVLFATSIGVLLAQGMFRLFGPRRTRLFAQIFAGVLGVGFLFAINLNNLLPQSTMDSFLRMLTDLMAYAPGLDSVVWLPARAALGEPLPFFVAVVLCVGLFLATTFGLANRLIDNAIAANGTAGRTVKASSSGWLAPHGGPLAVMRRKEWLLIARDPWLVSQIVMQMLVMVPAMFVIGKAGAVHYMWLGVVYLAGHLAGSLAWLTVSTEEAPDLLTTAPLRRRDVLWAKLQAALIPTAVLAAVPIAIAARIDLWLGFTIALCSVGAALCNSMLHVRNPTTAKRSELSWRGNSNKMISVFEMLIGLMWVLIGLTILMLGWWGILALILALPVVYRLMR